MFDEGPDPECLDLAILYMVVAIAHEKELVALGCQSFQDGAGLGRELNLRFMLSIHLDKGISLPYRERANHPEQVIKLAASAAPDHALH